jgi:hypothetical protein
VTRRDRARHQIADPPVDLDLERPVFPQPPAGVEQAVFDASGRSWAESFEPGCSVLRSPDVMTSAPARSAFDKNNASQSVSHRPSNSSRYRLTFARN